MFVRQYSVEFMISRFMHDFWISNEDIKTEMISFVDAQNWEKEADTS